MNTLILYCKNHIKERVIGENDTVYIGFNEQDDADIFLKKTSRSQVKLYYRNKTLKIKILGDVWSNGYKLSGTKDAEYIVYSLNNNNMAFEIIRTNDTNRPNDIIDISNEESITIGRNNEECKIILTDNEVSPVHACITKRDDMFYIIDKNSKNGIYLNNISYRTNNIAIYGKLTTETQLNSGDSFIIGKAIITYEKEKLYFNYEEGYVLNNISINSKNTCKYNTTKFGNEQKKRNIKIPFSVLDEENFFPDEHKFLCNFLCFIAYVTITVVFILITYKVIKSRLSSNTGEKSADFLTFVCTILMHLFSRLLQFIQEFCKSVFGLSYDKSKASFENKKSKNNLAKIENKIIAISRNRCAELNRINPNTSKCLEIAKQGINYGLWDRSLSNEKFIYLRVGTGNVKEELLIEFTDLDNKAYYNKVNHLRNKYSKICNAPITVDFRESKILNIYGKKDICMTLTKNLIVQAATHYSPSKLKIAAIFSENDSEFGWVDELPHALTIEDKKILKDGDVESIINFFNKSSSTEEDEMSYLLFIIACTDSSQKSSIEINYTKIMGKAKKVYLIMVEDSHVGTYDSSTRSHKILAMSNQNIKYICNENTISISEIDKPDNDLYNNFTNAMKKINNTIDNPSI